MAGTFAGMTTPPVPTVELLRSLASLFQGADDLPSLERALPDVARHVKLDALGAVVPGWASDDVVVLAFGASPTTVEATASHLAPGPRGLTTLTRPDVPAALGAAWDEAGFHHGLLVLAPYPGGPPAHLVGLRREPQWLLKDATSVAFEAAAIGVAQALERMSRRARVVARPRAEDPAWLQVVLGSIDAPLVLVDVEGVVRASNRAALRLLGCDEAMALGARVSSLWDEPSVPVTFTPESQSWSATTQVRNGRHFEVHSHALFGPSGAIEGALLELQPVEVMEQRRAAQSRAARLQTLGAMTATVAHDLNNLLLPLVMATNLLEEGRSEADRHEDAALLTDTATRAAAMVRELLDFGRGTPVPVETCEVSAVVQRTHTLIRRSLPADISLVMELKQVPRVSCAETDLVRVLVNLCLNARNAMEGRGNLVLRVFEVTLREPEPGAWKPVTAGRWVALEVQDTGAGIEASRMASLFQPYETTRFASGGTGLGLAMVRDVLERCGGAAQVCSHPGTGTTMRLFLRPAEFSPAPRLPAGGGR